MSYIRNDSDDDDDHRINPLQRVGPIMDVDDDDVELRVFGDDMSTSSSSDSDSSSSDSSSLSSSSDSSSSSDTDDDDDDDDNIDAKNHTIPTNDNNDTGMMMDTPSKSIKSSKNTKSKRFIKPISINQVTDALGVHWEWLNSGTTALLQSEQQQQQFPPSNHHKFVSHLSTLRLMLQKTNDIEMIPTNVIIKTREAICDKIQSQTVQSKITSFNPLTPTTQQYISSLDQNCIQIIPADEIDMFYSYHLELYLFELSLYTTILRLDQQCDEYIQQLSSLNQSTSTNLQDNVHNSIDVNLIESFITTLPQKLTHLLSFVLPPNDPLTSISMSTSTISQQEFNNNFASKILNTSQQNSENNNTSEITKITKSNNLLNSLKKKIKAIIRTQTIRCLIAIIMVFYNAQFIPLTLNIPMLMVSTLIDLGHSQLQSPTKIDTNGNNINDNDDDADGAFVMNFISEFVERPSILPLLLSTSPFDESIKPSFTSAYNINDKNNTNIDESNCDDNLILIFHELFAKHFQYFYKLVYGVSYHTTGYTLQKLQQYLLWSACYQPIRINIITPVTKTHMNKTLSTYSSHYKKIHKLSGNNNNNNDNDANLTRQIDIINEKMNKIKSSFTKSRFDGGCIEHVKVDNYINCNAIRQYYYQIKMSHLKKHHILDSDNTTIGIPYNLKHSNPFSTLLFAFDSTSPYYYNNTNNTQKHTNTNPINQSILQFLHTTKLIDNLTTFTMTMNPHTPTLKEFEKFEKKKNKDKEVVSNDGNAILDPHHPTITRKQFSSLDETILLQSRPMLSLEGDNNKNGSRGVDILYSRHAALFRTPNDNANYIKYYPRNLWLLDDLLQHTANSTFEHKNHVTTNQNDTNTLNLDTIIIKPMPELTLLHTPFDVDVYSTLMSFQPLDTVNSKNTPLHYSFQLLNNHSNNTYYTYTSLFYSVINTFQFNYLDNSTPTSGISSSQQQQEEDLFGDVTFPQYTTIDKINITPLFMLQLLNPIPSLGLFDSFSAQLRKANPTTASSKSKGGDNMNTFVNLGVKKTAKENYQLQSIMYKIMSNIETILFTHLITYMNRSVHINSTAFSINHYSDQSIYELKHVMMVYWNQYKAQFAKDNVFNNIAISFFPQITESTSMSTVSDKKINSIIDICIDYTIAQKYMSFDGEWKANKNKIPKQGLPITTIEQLQQILTSRINPLNYTLHHQPIQYTIIPSDNNTFQITNESIPLLQYLYTALQQQSTSSLCIIPVDSVIPHFIQQLMLLTQNYVKELQQFQQYQQQQQQQQQQHNQHLQSYTQHHEYSLEPLLYALKLLLLTSSVLIKAITLSQTESSTLETHFSAQLSFIINTLLCITPIPDTTSISQDEVALVSSNDANTSLITVFIITLQYWRTMTVTQQEQFTTKQISATTKFSSINVLTPAPLLTSLHSAMNMLVYFTLYNTNADYVTALLSPPASQHHQQQQQMSCPSASTPSPSIITHPQILPQIKSTYAILHDESDILTHDIYFNHMSLHNDNFNTNYKSYKNLPTISSSSLFATLSSVPNPVTLTSASMTEFVSNVGTVANKDNSWLFELITWLSFYSAPIYSTLLTSAPPSANTTSTTTSTAHNMIYNDIITISTHSIALAQHAVIVAIATLFKQVCYDSIAILHKGPEVMTYLHNKIKNVTNDGEIDLPTDDTYIQSLQVPLYEVSTTYIVPQSLIFNANIILSTTFGITSIDHNNTINSIHTNKTFINTFANQYQGIFAFLAIFWNLPQMYINNISSLSLFKLSQTPSRQPIITLSTLSSTPITLLPLSSSIPSSDEMTNNDSSHLATYTNHLLEAINSKTEMLDYYRTYITTPLIDYINYSESNDNNNNDEVDQNNNNNNKNTGSTTNIKTVPALQNAPYRFILALFQSIVELIHPVEANYPQLSSDFPCSVQSLRTKKEQFHQNKLDNGVVPVQYPLRIKSTQYISPIIQDLLYNLNPLSIMITSELNWNHYPDLISYDTDQVKSKQYEPISNQFVSMSEKYITSYLQANIISSLLGNIDLVTNYTSSLFNINSNNNNNNNVQSTQISHNTMCDDDNTSQHMSNDSVPTQTTTLMTYLYHQLQSLLPSIASYTNLHAAPHHIISLQSPFPATWSSLLQLYHNAMARKDDNKRDKNKADDVDANGHTKMERVKYSIMKQIAHIEGLLGLTSTPNLNNGDDNNDNKQKKNHADSHSHNQDKRPMSFKFKQKITNQLNTLYDDLAKVDPTFANETKKRALICDNDSLANDIDTNVNNHKHHRTNDIVYDSNIDQQNINNSDNNKNQNNESTMMMQQSNKSASITMQDNETVQDQHQHKNQHLPDSHIVFVTYIPQLTQEHMTTIVNHQQENFIKNRDENKNDTTTASDMNQIVSLDMNVSGTDSNSSDINKNNIDNDNNNNNGNQGSLQEQIVKYCKNILAQTFSKFGPVYTIILPLNHTTQLPRGSCKVIFEQEASAKSALEAKKIKVSYEFEPVRVSTTAKIEVFVATNQEHVPKGANKPNHSVDQSYNNKNNNKNNRFKKDDYKNYQPRTQNNGNDYKNHDNNLGNDSNKYQHDKRPSKPYHDKNNHGYTNKKGDRRNNNNDNNQHLSTNKKTDDSDDYYSMMMNKRNNEGDNASTQQQDNNNVIVTKDKPREKTAEEKRKARNAILGIKD